jgi:hypothetical protein
MVVALFAYGMLCLLGSGPEAKEILTTSLATTLSAAMGCIFSFMLPVSLTPKPADTATATETKIADAVMAPEIKTADAAVDVTAKALENHLALLDTRQSVLRIALYGMVCLAFFICIAGFVAPRLQSSSEPNAASPSNLFFHSLLYLLAAYCGVGLVLGVAARAIPVTGRLLYAVRCAGIASLLVGLVATLVSLPYTFDQLWRKEITAGPFVMPTIFWLALFRIVAGPLACTLFAALGYALAKVVPDKTWKDALRAVTAPLAPAARQTSQRAV